MSGILKFAKYFFRNLKFYSFVKRGRGLNYEVALFPLNNPLTPITLEVACNGAGALHAVYSKKPTLNFKIL
ncbi:hypothetical protein [Campylobacter concisus]|uniref:hypothetical protein n=1 Tax=Campylobacter concisus TaxID=199 RepID=UPI00112FAAC8|nr:hypothetical protein [Campylobacter concisus]